MEDFVRELNSGAALFVLYGDEGVGKSRVLEELVRTRLDKSRVHWIDLKAGGTGDGALIDSSGMIETVFAEAQEEDIVIADHFEMALQKTRHQLFLSWSTDGVDRRLNLVIAGRTDFFNELRQIAKQYQVRLQSFRLTSLSSDEAAAFLGFYLFPDRPIGRLSVPPLLRNQFAMAQGKIGKIIEIAERAGDQITSSPMDDTESIRKDSRVMVGVMIAVALVIGIGWYFVSRQTLRDALPRLANGSDVSVTQAGVGVAPAPDAVTPAQSGQAVETAAESAPAPASKAVSAEVTQANVAAQAEAEVAPTPDVVTTGQTGQSIETAAESTPAPASETVGAAAAVAQDGEETASPNTASEPVAEQQQASAQNSEGAAVAGSGTAPQAPAQTRLQRDLQKSLDWIRHADRKVGTLQIMLLNKDRFDETAFYEYIDSFASYGIDISTIRIFRTLTDGHEMYSVVYGVFDSWKAAGNARRRIPERLQKYSPIPRSVGGLLDEIQRLETEN